MAEKENELDYLGDDLIVLQGDNGEELEFIHVATIEYQNEWYAFLQPTKGVEEDEIIIMKIVSDDDGSDFFETVDDEDLMQAVYDEYLKLYEHQCHCEDCDKDCDEDCDCDGECDKNCHKK